MQYMPAGSRLTGKSVGFIVGYSEQYGLACVNTRFLSNFPNYYAFCILLLISKEKMI